MNSSPRPFRCPVCGRRLASHASLKAHLGEHARPERGANCGKQLRPPASQY